MKRLLLTWGCLGVALLGVGLYAGGACGPRRVFFVAQTQAGPPAKAETDPDRQAIEANIKTFLEAYNRQDVQPILALFTDDCELIESDGTVLRGLKELREELEETFAGSPRARISVSVDSFKVISPTVVLESGKTTFYPDGQTASAETEYQATHVKQAGQWKMSHVRSFQREMLSPYDRLRALEWLVGDWVDEGADSLVEAHYRWDDNKAFLLQEFTIRVKGRSVLKGTQRIGWDPLAKRIRAWVFDSEGGFAESLWTNVDGTWVLKAKGVRADGKIVTGTNELTQLGKDRLRFTSVDRLVGDERMPPMTVVAVRRPPAAKR